MRSSGSGLGISAFPSSSTQEVPGKPGRVHGPCPRRDRSEPWAAAPGWGARGGLLSQRHLWAARARTSPAPGSTALLSAPTRFPPRESWSQAHPSPRSRGWRDGADLVFQSPPIHCAEWLPDFKRTQKPGRQPHQGTRSPEERYWRPLFPTTVRRSSHNDSLFLLLWLAPIWPARSPYSKQWASSSADKTNR